MIKINKQIFRLKNKKINIQMIKDKKFKTKRKII